MSIHQELIQSLIGDDDELLMQFFVTFSRFEYALKRAGFVKSGDYDSTLPNWSRFAEEKGEALLGSIMDIEFIEARSFLFREPPQKQIIVQPSNRMQWQDNTKGSKENDAKYLLRLVRDVRNNLFHGGKYPDKPVSGQTLRNSKLLRACLIILETSLLLDDDVKRFFEEVYDE